MKYLYLIFLLVTGTACKEESKDETSSCKCFKLDSRAPGLSVANIRGSLKLTPPPLERITGKISVFIDEKHVFSDERHRLLEQEIGWS